MHIKATHTPANRSVAYGCMRAVVSEDTAVGRQAAKLVLLVSHVKAYITIILGSVRLWMDEPLRIAVGCGWDVLPWRSAEQV